MNGFRYRGSAETPNRYYTKQTFVYFGRLRGKWERKRKVDSRVCRPSVDGAKAFVWSSITIGGLSRRRRWFGRGGGLGVGGFPRAGEVDDAPFAAATAAAGAIRRAELEFDRVPHVEDEGVDRRVARADVALFLGRRCLWRWFGFAAWSRPGRARR